MFQRQAFQIDLGQQHSCVYYAFKALNSTFVFLVESLTEYSHQYTRKSNGALLHTDISGKTLFRKELNTKTESVSKFDLRMASPKQVLIIDRENRTMCLVDLEAQQQWNTYVILTFEEEYLTYFSETDLVCWKSGEYVYCQLLYFQLKDLRQNDAKPILEWNCDFEQTVQSSSVNNHSKIIFQTDLIKQIMEFWYFDLSNDPQGDFGKVRANASINIANYFVSDIVEDKPNVYVLLFSKVEEKNEGAPLKLYIMDARKDEQSAQIKQISLPFDSDPKYSKRHLSLVYSYIANLEDVWVFLESYTINQQSAFAIYYFRRDTYQLIYTEESIRSENKLRSVYFKPHLMPSYHTNINKLTKQTIKDFVMKITTMIVPFSLREVSLHFLLEINEDFDDDLLMEAVDLIE